MRLRQRGAVAKLDKGGVERGGLRFGLSITFGGDYAGKSSVPIVEFLRRRRQKGDCAKPCMLG